MEKEQIEIYEKTRKRTKQKKRLYYHFIAFLIGSFFLIILNIFFKVGIEYGEWFKYAVAAWLLIWVFHFINVFITNKFFNKEWERLETEKLIKKHKSKTEKLEKKLFKTGVISKETKASNPTKKGVEKNIITIIAALGKHRELGKDNQLIWHLPNDLKRFKKVTSGHDVIMGRKTYESLGGPLPSRTNIIITRNPDYKAPLCTVANSLEEALTQSTDPNPFILGGAQIYAQAIKIANKLDLTLVDASFDADAFFPEINSDIWIETSRENHKADEKHDYNYSFVTFERK